MQIVNNKVKVFDYSELSNEAKEKAKEQRLKTISEDRHEQFQEFANELLKLLGFENYIHPLTGTENIKVLYSLNNCQGDGCCFDFHLDTDELLGLLERLKNNKVMEDGYKRLIDVTGDLHDIVKDFEVNEKLIRGLELESFTETISPRYCHKKTRYVNLTDQGSFRTYNKKTNDYIESLRRLLTEIYETICDSFEVWGYEDIYHEVTDDEMESYAEWDDVVFLKSGEEYDWQEAEDVEYLTEDLSLYIESIKEDSYQLCDMENVVLDLISFVESGVTEHEDSITALCTFIENNSEKLCDMENEVMQLTYLVSVEILKQYNANQNNKVEGE